MGILDDIINDFFSVGASHVASTNIWREEPVDLYTFFVEYCGETPYEGLQEQFIREIGDIIWYKFTSEEREHLHSNHRVTEAVIMFGKGSGKDFLLSGILAYYAYLLCCLSDPQKFLGFGQGENINMVNIAINAAQARDVFLVKFNARLESCKFFKKVKGTPMAYNEYSPVMGKVRFYKNIVCFSSHSEAGAYEGFNPLLCIYDEIGGFEYNKAKFAYATLRSSATTRYNNRQLHIFISFPRHENDFMMYKYNQAILGTDPEMYCITGKSWEVRPTIDREEMEKDYLEDPEGAQLRYECIPAKTIGGLFKYPEKINDVVMVGKNKQHDGILIEPVERFRQVGFRNLSYTGLTISNLNLLDPSFTYYLGGDAAEKGDSYCLSLFHAEPTPVLVTEKNQYGDLVQIEKLVNKPVEDLLLEFRPNDKTKTMVDLLNISEIVEALCSTVRIKKALFDNFNSADTIQKLVDYGVDAENKVYSNPFQMKLYTTFKTLVYTGMISLLDYVSPYATDSVGIKTKTKNIILNPNEELKYLQVLNGNKIDHLPKFGKDFSDARVSAAYICNTDEVEYTYHTATPIIKSASRRNNTFKRKTFGGFFR